MLARLRSRAQDEKGFTLIELLVVVLIIGILAAIAIPAFLGQKKGAQDANAKSLLRNSAIAMESYYSDNQDFSYTTHGVAAGTVTSEMAKIEPNITFNAGGTAGVAKSNSVEVVIPASVDAYILSTTSASTTIYSYSRDVNAKTLKCAGTAKLVAADVVCPAASPKTW